MVGVVGAGRMGRALARAIAATGGHVLLAGGRDQAPPPSVPAGCTAAALPALWRQAALVLLALPFPAARELMSGAAGLLGAGRVLVDVTNPRLTPGAAFTAGQCGAVVLAEAARSWQVVKAFNTVPADALDAVRLHGHPVSVPVAGGSAAKAQVCELVRRLGFEPLDAGGLAAGRELESLAVLLVHIGRAGGWHGRVAIHIGPPDADQTTGRTTGPATGPLADLRAVDAPGGRYAVNG